MNLPASFEPWFLSVIGVFVEIVVILFFKVSIPTSVCSETDPISLLEVPATMTFPAGFSSLSLVIVSLPDGENSEADRSIITVEGLTWILGDLWTFCAGGGDLLTMTGKGGRTILIRDRCLSLSLLPLALCVSADKINNNIFSIY